MYLHLYNDHTRIAEIRICQGELQVVSTDDLFSPEEVGKLRKFLTAEPLPVFRNGKYVGTYGSSEPDFIVGVKMVLEQDYNPKLIIDDSPEELLGAINTLSPERQWRYALEIGKVALADAGLYECVERVLTALETGEEINPYALSNLLIHFSGDFEENDWDDFRLTAVLALMFLIPANPVAATREASAILLRRV